MKTITYEISTFNEQIKWILLYTGYPSSTLENFVNFSFRIQLRMSCFSWFKFYSHFLETDRSELPQV